MILVDGKEAKNLPVDDRGLAYGDGLFETMRVVEGRIPLLDFHLERLAHGASVLRITPLDMDTIRAELVQAAGKQSSGIVKLVVTRGSGGRGYASAADMAPRRIVQTMPQPAHPAAWRENGVVLRICDTRLEGPKRLDGVKHLNRLAQVLARAEWCDPAVHEGLMRDAEGRLVEGTASNLFIRRAERLLTPPVGAGVRGVMRRVVLEQAAHLGLDVAEKHFSDEEFFGADEIFITNSLIGVCPVVRCASHVFSIGTITRRLQEAVETGLEQR